MFCSGSSLSWAAHWAGLSSEAASVYTDISITQGTRAKIEGQNAIEQYNIMAMKYESCCPVCEVFLVEERLHDVCGVVAGPQPPDGGRVHAALIEQLQLPELTSVLLQPEDQI